MNLTASQKMTKARAGLLLDEPFFGSLALRLIMQEVQDGRIYTDGEKLSYDSKAIDGYTLDECKGVIAHEVMHLALSHHLRLKEREHSTANQAMDYAINGILRKSFKMPEGVLYSPEFDGKAWEEIYGILYGRKAKKETPGQDEKDGSGGQQGQGQGQAGEGQESTNDDPNGSGEAKPGKGEEQPPAWGQVEQAQDPDAQAADWKIAVQQAARAAQSRGKLPAGMERIIQDIINPVIDWKTILRDFIDRAARNDYNFSRPNLRYMGSGFILPSLISDELPELAIAVDTSGSITDSDIAQIQPELQSLLDIFKTHITVLYCDSRLHENNIQELESGDEIVLTPKGGGGTDFRPIFNYLERNGETPAALIYITDMDGDFPENDPGFPVMWIDTHKYGRGHLPPFGEYVKLYR